MTLYEEWHDRAEKLETDAQQQEYWDAYFTAETENYKKILSEKSFLYEGTLGELAKQFSMDDATFCGFLDGINTSLDKALDLDGLAPDTALTLKILPEKLYYNMLGAKASWLYGLPEWDGVLSVSQRHEITKAFRSANIFVSEKKTGRNEPCPCGSGKKYKNCCGKV